MIGIQVQVKIILPKLSVSSIIRIYPDKYGVKSFGKTQSFSWNSSLSHHITWNKLLKDFQYLLLVKSCHPLLTMGAIAVSNPRPQLLTDATDFAWISLLQTSIGWKEATKRSATSTNHAHRFKLLLYLFCCSHLSMIFDLVIDNKLCLINLVTNCIWSIW